MTRTHVSSPQISPAPVIGVGTADVSRRRQVRIRNIRHADARPRAVCILLKTPTAPTLRSAR